MFKTVLRIITGSAATDPKTENQTATGLRVAIPSFGIPGIRVVPNEPEIEKTSRAEIEEIFEAELLGKSLSPDANHFGFTKGERTELLVNQKLRDALYSDMKKAA